MKWGFRILKWGFRILRWDFRILQWDFRILRVDFRILEKSAYLQPDTSDSEGSRPTAQSAITNKSATAF